MGFRRLAGDKPVPYGSCRRGAVGATLSRPSGRAVVRAVAPDLSCTLAKSTGSGAWTPFFNILTMSPASTPPEWALESPVARLATVDGERPHLVPVVFCALDGALFIPVDGKPKSRARLKRLRNIERNRAVAVLVDRYSDDWSDLRWTRIDGRAEIVTTDERIRTALRAKYPQYEHVDVGTTAIRVTIEGVVSWSAKGRRPSGLRNLNQ